MRQYSQVHKTTLALLFLAYIGLFTCANLLTPSRTFSESENRRLELLPQFSLDSLAEGQLTTDFERYISDQFVLRDLWIGIKSSADKLFGKRDSNGVLIGQQGYLMQQFAKPKADEVDLRVRALNTLASSFPKLNKVVALVPNAIEIMDEELSPFTPVVRQYPYLREFQQDLAPSIGFADIYHALQARDEEYLFYRTDHHWTTLGAFYAYREVASAMGLTAHTEDYFTKERFTDSFYGTLQSKSGLRNLLPDNIDLYIPREPENHTISYLDTLQTSGTLYDRNAINKKDKYAVFLGGNHALIKINTDNHNQRKLLLLKDSYANAMIPFLTGHFSEIDVVDLRYYDGDLRSLITDNRITDLLVLYNVDTFFADSSILSLCDYALPEGIDVAQDSEAIGGLSQVTTAELAGVESSLDGLLAAFSDDLFIGDSISEGLTFYGYLDSANALAGKGMNFAQAKTQLPILEQRKPRRVYILLGLNVIAYDRDTFVSQYTELVRGIKQATPGSQIIVQSVLPVQPQVAAERPQFSQQHIDECNAGIEQMAAEEQITYLNTAEIVKQELYEGDGIHFMEPFYPLWLSYLSEHS